MTRFPLDIIAVSRGLGVLNFSANVDVGDSELGDVEEKGCNVLRCRFSRI